jgi:hypothetical protein
MYYNYEYIIFQTHLGLEVRKAVLINVNILRDIAL